MIFFLEIRRLSLISKMLMKFVTACGVLFPSFAYTASSPDETTRLDTIGKRDVATFLAPKLSHNASVIFPQNSDWAEVTERWDKYQAPTFRAAVEVGTQEDVVSVVSLI